MFLHPGAKLAQKVDIQGALYTSVAKTHGEEAATTIIAASRTIQQHRAALHEPPTTEVTHHALLKYHAALAYLLDTAKLRPELDTPLLWVNAFDPEDHAAIADLRYDRLATLFNLAVNEANLATAAYRHRRTDPTALRRTTKHFQLAAGFFRVASDQPTPGGVHVMTCDLHPTALRALQYAMLGNAQQAFYLLCVHNATTGGALLARFAMGARDFYDVAAETCRDGGSGEARVMARVGLPAAALAALCEARAHDASAAAARDAHDVGQELGRLPRAAAAIGAAQSASKALDVLSSANPNGNPGGGGGGSGAGGIHVLREKLDATLAEMQHDVAQRLESVEEENRQLYFVSVATTLPQLGCHQSVKAGDVTKALAHGPADAGMVDNDGTVQRLGAFAQLPDVSDPHATEMARRYADMAESATAAAIARLNTMGSNVRHASADGASQCQAARAYLEKRRHEQQGAAPLTLAGEERQAVDMIQAAQRGGGVAILREKRAAVIGQAECIRLDIEAVEDVLQKEDAQDRELKGKVGTRRTSSHELTYQYRNKLTKLRSNLEQAANADLMVYNALNTHATAMDAMIQLDVSGMVQAALQAAPVTTDAHGAQMEQLISALEKDALDVDGALGQKDGIVERLEKEKELDNAFRATNSVHQEAQDVVELLCSLVEARYGQLKHEATVVCDDLAARAARTSGMAQQLGQLSGGDGAGDGMDAAARKNQTMMVIYKHQAAAIKFTETHTHLEQGAHFYAKEQANVSILRRDVDDYVLARQTECSELMAHASGAGGPAGRGSGGNPYAPMGNTPQAPAAGYHGQYRGHR